MRLKLYRSDDVDTAVKAAGQELGEDAMLISVEKSQTHEFPLGRYRIVFASGLPSLSAASAQRNVPKRDQVPNWNEIRSSLGLLADQLSAPPAKSASHGIRQILVNCGLSDADVPAIEKAITHSTIQELIKQTIRLKPNKDASMAVFFGPAGSGKSTAIEKLAFQESLAGKHVLIIRAFQSNQAPRPVHIDPRVVALLAPSLRELDVISKIQPPPNLILIDTPSQLALMPEDQSKFLSDWIHSQRAVVHLVLSAVTRLQEWQKYCANFRHLRPSRLLLTHVDEVVSWAGVWSAVLASGLDCSFFSAGPLVTDPIELASSDRFLNGFIDMNNEVMRIKSGKLASKSVSAN